MQVHPYGDVNQFDLDTRQNAGALTANISSPSGEYRQVSGFWRATVTPTRLSRVVNWQFARTNR